MYLFTLLGTIHVFGQGSKEFKKALELSQSGQLEKALKICDQNISKKGASLEFSGLAGKICQDQKNFSKALSYYDQVVNTPGVNASIILRSIECCWELNKYERVIDLAKLDVLKSDITRKTQAEKYVRDSEFLLHNSANTRKITPENCGPAINTTDMEYLPSFTVDGGALYFTRRIQGQEDIYLSEQVNDQWTKANPLDEVNTTENEGAHSIAPDGSFLTYTGCGKRDGKGGCDLYFSIKEEGSFRKAFHPGAPLNTNKNETQPCLAENGRTLFFASDRQGGYGGMDIWFSRLQKNGKWGEPINCGRVINTTSDELTPFLHADGSTLYFTSGGHPGFGATDIFLSRWISDTSWTKPMNAGPGINSKNTESAFIVSTDGQYGYFVSDQKYDGVPSFGKTDIYRVPIPKEFQPNAATYALIEVIDAETKKDLSAEVRITNVDQNKIFGIKRTSMDDPAIFSIPANQWIAIHAKASGYTFYSGQQKLEGGGTALTPIHLQIPLKKIEAVKKDETYVLQNIFFESGSDQLKAESLTELSQLFNFMKEQPSIRLRIHGHTDDQGSDSDNQVLSEKRAAAVVNWLTQNGIDSKRCSSKGWGESKPIASNATEEGRKINRRTEFEIWSE